MDTELGPVDGGGVCGPSGGGSFDVRRLALWLIACLGLGVAVAWGAAAAEERLAPWIIFPLLVGVVLGALLVGLMRLGQFGHRATILLGAVLAVAVVVVGQHYVRYRAQRELLHQQVEELRRARLSHPGLSEIPTPLPPASLFDFLRAEARAGRAMQIGGFVARGWVAWGSWVLDGLLVLTATLAIAIPAARLPFCSRCGSWYRVTRSGRIDGATVGRLAELVGVDLEGPPISGRYRLSNCNGGCGPTAFELMWEQAGAGGFSVRIWLDVSGRRQIVRQLDEGVGEGSGIGDSKGIRD